MLQIRRRIRAALDSGDLLESLRQWDGKQAYSGVKIECAVAFGVRKSRRHQTTYQETIHLEERSRADAEVKIARFIRESSARVTGDLSAQPIKEMSRQWFGRVEHIHLNVCFVRE